MNDTKENIRIDAEMEALISSTVERRCECDHTGVRNPELEHLYAPLSEWPYVEHEPGQCKCTNGIESYLRGGKIMWLCSCCHVTGDIPA